MGIGDRCIRTGKISYPTNKAARHASIKFKHRSTAHYGKREPALQVFSCAHCGGWHLGHKRAKQNSRRDQHLGIGD